MKTLSCLLTLAGLSVLVPVTRASGLERTVEKTFSVQPGGSLQVETSGGEIRVQSSDEPTVRITARKKFRTSSESEADEIEGKLSLTLEQRGNDIVAIAKYEGQRPFNFSGNWPPVQVSFLVTAPASFASKLRTSGGNIIVGEMGAPVHARTSGGDIRLGKIGGEVDAGTSGGNVSLDVGGAAAKLHTSGGDIAVGRVTGVADLDTSGGSIKIDTVENTIHASTSGGNVHAGISGPLKGDCELRTSGGNVTAEVSKAASFRLDASTSGGGVNAEGLTITIEKGGAGRSRLSGDVNGGGPTLRLRSSGGDIRVRVQ